MSFKHNKHNFNGSMFFGEQLTVAEQAVFTQTCEPSSPYELKDVAGWENAWDAARSAFDHDPINGAAKLTLVAKFAGGSICTIVGKSRWQDYTVPDIALYDPVTDTLQVSLADIGIFSTVPEIL